MWQNARMPTGPYPTDPQSTDPSETELSAVDNHVDRARDELKRLLRERKLSQRAVEARFGWSRGYLSQVFQGRITLTLAHVLSLLKAIDLPSVDFFHSLDESADPLPMDEIRNRLDQYDAQFEVLRQKGLLGPELWKGQVGEDS